MPLKTQTHSGLGRLWSEEERKRLKLLLQDHTADEIGKILGRSKNAIHSQRRRRGFSPPIRIRGGDRIRPWKYDLSELYRLAEDPQVSRDTAAKILGRTPGSTKSACQRYHIRWNQGFMTAVELAEEFDLSPDTVGIVLAILFPTRRPKAGSNWTLTDEDADRARKHLRRYIRD